MRLTEFYEKHFPVDLFLRFLAQQPHLLPHRELVYTWATSKAPRRFCQADNLREFLVSRCPQRVDIGAEYATPVSWRELRIDMEPVGRELCFDIDVTDYADVRGCSTEKTHIICKQCWKFVACAIETTDYLLRRCFGFRHLLWVFSGRRGAHCWVLDKSVFYMLDPQRKAIAEFFNSLAKCSVPLSTQDACEDVYLRFLQPHFEQMLQSGVLDFSDRVLPLLGECVFPIAAKPGTNNMLRVTEESTLQRWTRWKKFLSNEKEIAMRVAFRFLAPRLDLNVTRSTGHLLRAPFSVHQQTGLLCTPIHITPALYELDPVYDPINVHISRSIDKIPDCVQHFAVTSMPRAHWFDYLLCYYCFKVAQKPFENLASARFLFAWQVESWEEHVCAEHPGQPLLREKSTLGSRIVKMVLNKETLCEDYELKSYLYNRCEAQLAYLNKRV
jgi:DNA primase small subunit